MPEEIPPSSKIETLQRAAYLLDESWNRDVLPLRASRMLHGRVKALFGKLGIDGRIIGRIWYEDHVLGSIRRMVDTGTDVISIRQALVELRGVASEVDAETLLELHGPDRSYDDERNRRMSAAWVRLTVTGARPNEPEADTTVIGVRTVQADLDRIREVADRAHRLATMVAAHRLDTDEQIVVTDDEVAVLLEDLSQIYARWSLPLRGVDVDTSIDRLSFGYRLSEALQLYDHAAVGEAMREYLWTARFDDEPPPPRVELVKRMRPIYEFDSGTDDA